jgi:DNA-binding NtrC family response regulator
MSRILLASNEKSISAILIKLLKTEGYKVVSATDTSKAKELLNAEQYNLMIVTAGKGGEADMAADVIAESRAHHTAMPIIAIIESDGGRTATRLSQFQLFACIEKPLKVDKLVSAVQKAVDLGAATESGNVNFNLQLEAYYQYENIVAESPAMKSACDMISRVAGTDVTILISGEPGTGKELVARTIHANSRRKEKNLVVINCSLPDAERDLFSQNGIEKANGGTLVLQEISGLPKTAQQSLLKCLQERKLTKSDASQPVALDLRIVATTSMNLQQLVSDGKFHPDLYKYVRIIFIQLAPLRDRQQDIIPTIRRILMKKIGEGKVLPVLDQEAIDILQKYSWPGNVDEIELVMEQVLKNVKDGKITKASLPPEIAKT